MSKGQIALRVLMRFFFSILFSEGKPYRHQAHWAMEIDINQYKCLLSHELYRSMKHFLFFFLSLSFSSLSLSPLASIIVNQQQCAINITDFYYPLSLLLASHTHKYKKKHEKTQKIYINTKWWQMSRSERKHVDWMLNANTITMRIWHSHHRHFTACCLFSHSPQPIIFIIAHKLDNNLPSNNNVSQQFTLLSTSFFVIFFVCVIFEIWTFLFPSTFELLLMAPIKSLCNLKSTAWITQKTNRKCLENRCFTPVWISISKRKIDFSAGQKIF